MVLKFNRVATVAFGTVDNTKRSRVLLSASQELDDDPGVEAPVVGAWQDGELRVRKSFAQGEGVLPGDLLVAIADHDQRQPGVTLEVLDREGRLLAMHPVELILHDPEVLPSVGGDGAPIVDEERQRLVV